jgi:hypothetical protein|nr:hypothetical protein [Neorhizobium tomejilense]
MTIHQPSIWSLWSVQGRGLFLLSDDKPGVLIQEVTLTVERDGVDGAVMATSKSPTARKTLLEGEGGHSGLFELVLASQLELLGIDRSLAERVDIEDVMPVVAAPTRAAAMR